MSRSLASHGNIIGGNIIGIDVGGANLKYCSSSGKATATNFPMWRQPESLADTLVRDLKSFQPFSTLAVTMTGELADCFADRAAGVNWIVDHVAIAASRLSIDGLWFYGIDGRFYSADGAKSHPDIVAAANWHAAGQLCGRDISGGDDRCRYWIDNDGHHSFGGRPSCDDCGNRP